MKSVLSSTASVVPAVPVVPVVPAVPAAARLAEASRELATSDAQGTCVALGFGPGLMAEGLLLQR